MKEVYQAGNTVDAQLLCNWLQQAGINASVEGGYLQGGIGELQAIGIVRVVVEDADFYAARDVVEHWDALQQSQHGQDSDQRELREKRVARLGRRFMAQFFKIAVFIAAALMAIVWLRR
ncbi:MAG: DUF2007 domain-containing protein [Pseudomonadales bacterium]|nr:DUF2007 domain-containing protein [Pseudomonadales bacterium]RZV57423.1 MAG: DUF2007 domain-containing protein [Pseudomonadales bacterium]